MALDVIGAGLGRTGTQSLKVALERLLAAPCYDMYDLLRHPEHAQIWERALDGHTVDWDTLFSSHRSTVDMTAALFFEQLVEAYPKATVVLSLRDVDSWWQSFNNTLVAALQADPPDDPFAKATKPSRELTLRMLSTRFTPDWMEETAAKSAYERHNRAVRETIPSDRLAEWRADEGWGPICAALRLPVPTEPFPRVNTAADFRTQFVER